MPPPLYHSADDGLLLEQLPKVKVLANTEREGELHHSSRQTVHYNKLLKVWSGQEWRGLTMLQGKCWHSLTVTVNAMKDGCNHSFSTSKMWEAQWTNTLTNSLNLLESIGSCQPYYWCDQHGQFPLYSSVSRFSRRLASIWYHKHSFHCHSIWLELTLQMGRTLG